MSTPVRTGGAAAEDAGPDSVVDAVVVGAGPAGAAAALELARAGCSVVLLERGPFPGAKNMYGGVVYGRILDTLIPEWWTEAPIQRWVTRRQTMLLTPTQSMAIDFRTESWGRPPYNGATAYRPDFDAWLASKAVDAGARLVCSTTATGVLRDEGGRVVGVQTDRPGGQLRARVVIACDGVNSFLAKDAGLYRETDPANYTLGVKETLALPRWVIEDRFAVSGRDGVDIEILGCTQGVPGGGFIYTNLDTISVGLVLQLPALAAQSRRPEELLGTLKAHPAVAPLVAGAEITEYSAHVIPEAGFDMMPELIADGMLVAGDAAAMCLAAGIWLEGVNFAIGSGAAAGRSAALAVRDGDVSAAGLATYRERLERSFVLANHRKMREVPHLLMGPLVQQQSPELVCNIVERVFRVDDPTPKPGIRRIVREELKRSGIKPRELARATWTALKAYG